MPTAVAALVPFANCPTCFSTGGGGGGTVTALNDLTDVTLTGPFTAGQVLRYNGFQWVNTELDLNDLGDVNAVAPADGQTIVWDSAANAGAGGYVLGNAGTAANPSVHLTDAAVGPATAGAPTVAEITAAAGANRDVVLYYTGTNTATDAVTYAYYIDVNGVVTRLEAPAVAASTANPTVHLTNTAVAPAVAGAPTVAEITAAAGTNRDRALYYTGTDNPADPTTYAYWIDVNGLVTELNTPATVTPTANPTTHLTNTAVAPAAVGEPTIMEITVAAAAGGLTNRILTYTGTDAAGDPVTHVYHVDVAGLVTLVQRPNTEAPNPVVHLTNTAVAPATAGQPTIAEITAAAGANRDVFLTYTGTDTNTDAVTYAFYIDPDGRVVLVEAPPVASCALRELGGVSGQLAVGDGLGVPNPVTTGFTLQQDNLYAIATTPPVGGVDVFEIRLMPGPTIISTGTVAAGASVATFTPFADVVFTAGQWIETVVTATAPTPSSQLTVVGEVCGPGVSASGAGFSDRDEVHKASTLPVDDTNHDLIDLEGHPTLPNGLYRWDASTGGGSWVQV